MSFILVLRRVDGGLPLFLLEFFRAFSKMFFCRRVVTAYVSQHFQPSQSHFLVQKCHDGVAFFVFHNIWPMNFFQSSYVLFLEGVY